MKVAIIGTVGVPANYGGFETLVEQLVRHNSSDEIQYAVYCSKKSYDEERWVYHGAKTEYVGLNANGMQSIPYDILSLVKLYLCWVCRDVLSYRYSGCSRRRSW